MSTPIHDPVIASIVLVDRGGVVLGKLPEIPTTTPWWQEVGEIVTLVREKHDLAITVLRLLESERRRPPGGVVTYLAELDPDSRPVPHLIPFEGQIHDDPLRLPYAKPGGPAHDLEWARDALDAAGIAGPISARQVRTWNLSSIWRLTAGDRRFWLKVVPPFFAHEGATLALFEGEPVPRLVTRDTRRVLMPEIPGDDCYAADTRQIERMVEMLVDLQWRWRDRLPELAACGLPQWDLTEYRTRALDVLQRHGKRLGDADAELLTRFIDDLDERWHAIDACGVPNTLVHGDFHPGNVRATGDELTIMDWGDCYIGNPLLDRPPMLERVPEKRADQVDQVWLLYWRDRLPNADIDTAARLLRPVAAMRLVLVYQMFLDNIEASERVYHRDDPDIWLLKTASILREA